MLCSYRLRSDLEGIFKAAARVLDVSREVATTSVEALAESAGNAHIWAFILKSVNPSRLLTVAAIAVYQ